MAKYLEGTDQQKNRAYSPAVITEGGRTVWLAVADASGRVTRQLVEPLSVEGGRVTVLDRGQNLQRTVSVHRVTGVVDATGVVGTP